MGAEGKSRQLGDLSRGALGKFGMRVQARADRASTDREIVESVENQIQALDVALARETLFIWRGKGALTSLCAAGIRCRFTSASASWILPS